MKINEETIQYLQNVLENYIAESGDNLGKFLFSKELGEIENILYSNVKNTSFQLDSTDYASEIFHNDVEGELPVVDDTEQLPLLEVI